MFMVRQGLPCHRGYKRIVYGRNTYIKNARIGYGAAKALWATRGRAPQREIADARRVGATVEERPRFRGVY